MNLVSNLEMAHANGDYHEFLRLKIEQMSALHAAGKSADPNRYRGTEMLRQIEMLKACDLAMWQMKEALGYPIPSAVDVLYPRQLAGNAGSNPFKCGTCDARTKYPDLHLKHDAERHGGLYVGPDRFHTA